MICHQNYHQKKYTYQSSQIQVFHLKFFYPFLQQDLSKDKTEEIKKVPFLTHQKSEVLLGPRFHISKKLEDQQNFFEDW